MSLPSKITSASLPPEPEKISTFFELRGDRNATLSLFETVPPLIRSVISAVMPSGPSTILVSGALPHEGSDNKMSGKAKTLIGSPAQRADILP